MELQILSTKYFSGLDRYGRIRIFFLCNVPAWVLTRTALDTRCEVRLESGVFHLGDRWCKVGAIHFRVEQQLSLDQQLSFEA